MNNDQIQLNNLGTELIKKCPALEYIDPIKNKVDVLNCNWCSKEIKINIDARIEEVKEAHRFTNLWSRDDIWEFDEYQKHYLRMLW